MAKQKESPYQIIGQENLPPELFTSYQIQVGSILPALETDATITPEVQELAGQIKASSLLYHDPPMRVRSGDIPKWVRDAIDREVNRELSRDR
jgi:hypothetical protein